MTKKKYDVVIVGAGPGGLKAAEILAKNNRKVLVLEKNKKLGIKACAGGLTRKNNLIDLPIENIGERFFSSFKYYFRGRKNTISNKKPMIVAAEREKLGEFMKNKTEKSGAEIQLNCSVTKISDKFVLVNENLKGTAALKRSKQLVKGYFWPVLGRFLLLALIAIGLSFVITPLSLLFSFSAPLIGNLISSIIYLPVGIFSTIYSYQIYLNLKKIKGRR